MAKGDRRETNGVTITLLIRKENQCSHIKDLAVRWLTLATSWLAQLSGVFDQSTPPSHPTAKRIPGNFQGF